MWGLGRIMTWEKCSCSLLYELRVWFKVCKCTLEISGLNLFFEAIRYPRLSCHRAKSKNKCKRETDVDKCKPWSCFKISANGGGIPAPASSPCTLGSTCVHLAAGSVWVWNYNKKTSRPYFQWCWKSAPLTDFNAGRSTQDGRSRLCQARCISLGLKIVTSIVKLYERFMGENFVLMGCYSIQITFLDVCPRHGLSLCKSWEVSWEFLSLAAPGRIHRIAHYSRAKWIWSQL